MTTKSSSSLGARITAITDLFAYPLRTSHYLELVNPLWTTHALQARVEKVWDETKDARTLTLRPGVNWRNHRPGQHARLGVPIGGKHYTRTYSISSPPERDDGCITVTVKAVAGGRMSHHIVRNVKPGDYLPLGLPQGDFILNDAVPTRPLFISAGSGITPVMCMIRSLIAQERLPDSVHIHYAPHPYDVIFGGEIKELADKHPRYQLHLVYTREFGTGAPAGVIEKELLSPASRLEAPTFGAPGAAQPGSRHFSAAQLHELCPDWQKRDAFACGPQTLLDAVEAHWKQAGLTRHLNVERFRAALAKLPTDAKGGRIRFIKSAVEVQADGQTSLLRVAEDAGLNPPHGCRMGICHTCNTKLISGCVRDLRTGKLINEPGGIVQTCISAAAGDAELDS